jgi:hypothetical protein
MINILYIFCHEHENYQNKGIFQKTKTNNDKNRTNSNIIRKKSRQGSTRNMQDIPLLCSSMKNWKKKKQGYGARSYNRPMLSI